SSGGSWSVGKRERYCLPALRSAKFIFAADSSSGSVNKSIADSERVFAALPSCLYGQCSCRHRRSIARNVPASLKLCEKAIDGKWSSIRFYLDHTAPADP